MADAAIDRYSRLDWLAACPVLTDPCEWPHKTIATFVVPDTTFVRQALSFLSQLRIPTL